MDVLNQLGIALVTELAMRVPNATPYSTGTLKRGLGSFEVQDRHITVGDPSFFESWKENAPEHTIGDFIRYMLENKLGYFSARWGGWKQRHLRARARERRQQIKTRKRERQQAIKARKRERIKFAKEKKRVAALPQSKRVVKPSRNKNWGAFGQVLKSFYHKRETNADVDRFFTLQTKLTRARITYTRQMSYAKRILRITKRKLSPSQIRDAQQLIRDTFQSHVAREKRKAIKNRQTANSNKSYQNHSARVQAKEKTGQVGGVVAEHEDKRQAAISAAKSRRRR